MSAPQSINYESKLQLNGSSGVVSAATASVTLTPGTGQRAYLASFDLTGLGATAGSTITGTITGLTSGGTLSYLVTIPAGVTTAITPLIRNFDIPLAASAINTAIVVSFPSFGTGNTSACLNATGFCQ